MDFDRWASGARISLVMAQEYARQRRHQHISPEHLAIGSLFLPEFASVRILEELGADREQLRSRLFGGMPPGTTEPPKTIPLAPATRQLITAIGQESDRLGGGAIDTRHILLALTRLPGSARNALEEFGADYASVTALLGETDAPITFPLGKNSAWPPPEPAQSATDLPPLTTLAEVQPSRFRRRKSR